MKYDYKKEKLVSYSECDKKTVLDLINIYKISEDMATEYYGTMKSDNITLRKENNAAWVYTKIAVHINEFPKWREKLICRSYTVVKTRIKNVVETSVKNEDGKIFFIIDQEACPIDLETRKIRKIETVSYPTDMECEETAVQEQFARLIGKFDEKDYAYSQIVQACDIDYTNHTNNTMYVKYIMNSFNSDYWNDKKIINFEIQYLKESREKETLKIYKKQTEENTIEFLIKRDEDELIKARLQYENI